MIPPQSTLTPRPMSQILAGTIISVGFIAATAVGLLTDHLTIALNGYIVLIVVVSEIAILRFWKSFAREVEASQLALLQCMGKTADFILQMKRDAITPVFLQVLQDTLVKAKNRRGSDHAASLAACETGLLQQPNLINMLASRCVPSLGMSATVVGLLLVMMEIGRGLQLADDIDALTDSILHAVGSLAMSFSTTATALVLGPLMVGVQVEHCRRAVHQYVDQLDAILGSFNCSEGLETEEEKQ